jgi:hypothetical protein
MLPHLFAYLDLASGSMIIQGIIAGAVAVPILLRNQIRRALGRGKPADDGLMDDPAATTDASSDTVHDVRVEGSDTSRP